jgi:hypothetical protein
MLETHRQLIRSGGAARVVGAKLVQDVQEEILATKPEAHAPASTPAPAEPKSKRRSGRSGS